MTTRELDDLEDRFGDDRYWPGDEPRERKRRRDMLDQEPDRDDEDDDEEE